jgi:ankyrin repeat protein
MADEPQTPSADDAAVIQAITAGDAVLLRSAIERNPAAARARDPSGVSAILLARYHGRTDLVDILLSVEPELDIFEASALGRIGRVRELLGTNPDLVHAWSTDGFTSLHLAAFIGHPDVVQLLLERGAVPGAPSRNQMAVHPLHSAAATGQHQAAELLLSYGAQANARQRGGWTAIHSSASNGDVQLTRLLLSHGADPTQKSDDGKTALDLAAEKGHPQIVQLLSSSLKPSS